MSSLDVEVSDCCMLFPGEGGGGRREGGGEGGGGKGREREGEGKGEGGGREGGNETVGSSTMEYAPHMCVCVCAFVHVHIMCVLCHSCVCGVCCVRYVWWC